MLPIARVRTARGAVLELLARHDVRDAGTDERIQSLVDDLASMLRFAATGRLTVADAVDALGTPERVAAVTLAELVRTALPGRGEASADQRAAAREVVALVFRWLATDTGQQIARVCRDGLARADHERGELA
ncbi:MAG: hypothetical protein DYG90_05655 [Chloroflexi bacterium CFX6]|nr:hypothetical protein [Chloroflexi bacterium CFX6]